MSASPPPSNLECLKHSSPNPCDEGLKYLPNSNNGGSAIKGTCRGSLNKNRNTSTLTPGKKPWSNVCFTAAIETRMLKAFKSNPCDEGLKYLPNSNNGGLRH